MRRRPHAAARTSPQADTDTGSPPPTALRTPGRRLSENHARRPPHHRRASAERFFAAVATGIRSAVGEGRKTHRPTHGTTDKKPSTPHTRRRPRIRHQITSEPLHVAAMARLPSFSGPIRNRSPLRTGLIRKRPHPDSPAGAETGIRLFRAIDDDTPRHRTSGIVYFPSPIFSIKACVSGLCPRKST